MWEAILEAQLKARKTSHPEQSTETPISVSHSPQDADSLQFQSFEAEFASMQGTNAAFTDIQQNFRFTMNSREWPNADGAEIDLSSLAVQVDDKFPDVAEIEELYVFNLTMNWR